jgi:hypothetical protein
MKTDQKNEGSLSENDDQEALRSHIEFMWQSLRETADLLLKASSFFLAIMAAILGYVVYRPLAPTVRATAFWVVGSTTLLFVVAVGSVAWGLYTGLHDLQAALERLSRSTFSNLGLGHYFRRARTVFWIVIAASLLVIAILVVGISVSLSAGG